jgi:hypothetical protein
MPLSAIITNDLLVNRSNVLDPLTDKVIKFSFFLLLAARLSEHPHKLVVHYIKQLVHTLMMQSLPFPRFLAKLSTHEKLFFCKLISSMPREAISENFDHSVTKLELISIYLRLGTCIFRRQSILVILLLHNQSYSRDSIFESCKCYRDIILLPPMFMIFSLV